jgi:methoxymalonate biosynthesis acyl carrier protein
MAMDVRSRIKSYFGEAIPVPLRDEDDIFDLGVVDSLFAMQLVSFVENEFTITAEREDLDILNFCSIDALTNFVTRKVGDRGAGAEA